jgi:hypothetical protein
MAHPSDLRGEISEIAEDLDLSGPSGPLIHNLDDKRRKRDSVKRSEALSLKLAGLTYEQIAERLEISVSGARDLVNRTLARAENQNVEEMRDLENARLDRAQTVIWTAMLGGDLKAVDAFLRISQRRSKLNGLDAPTKINLSVNVRQEMETALAALENIVLGEVIRESQSTD